eukprot:7965807-Pyramimonas_sp.AAC.1
MAREAPPDPRRVMIFALRRPPEVSTHSSGPMSHLESFSDGPEAWPGPPDARNGEEPPVAHFSLFEGAWARRRGAHVL